MTYRSEARTIAPAELVPRARSPLLVLTFEAPPATIPKVLQAQAGNVFEVLSTFEDARGLVEAGEDPIGCELWDGPVWPNLRLIAPGVFLANTGAELEGLLPELLHGHRVIPLEALLTACWPDWFPPFEAESCFEHEVSMMGELARIALTLPCLESAEERLRYVVRSCFSDFEDFPHEQYTDRWFWEVLKWDQ